MPLPLQDPRKRWLRPLSGQWNRSPYERWYSPPPTPGVEETGALYAPAGNGEWKPAYPAQDEEQAAWNWEQPPLDQNGVQLNSQNEPLPEGALGWTPFSEPDWGPGIAGWWKGTVYRITEKPVQPIAYVGDPLKDLAAGNNEQAWESFKGNVGAVSKRVFSKDVLSSFTGKYVSRSIVEALKTAGEGVNLLLAQPIERGLGTVSETLEDVGEGATILPELRYPDWLPSVVETLSNMTPPILGYNAIRAASMLPQKSWDEVRDTAKDNWQASRIAYSAFGDEALKAEYIRRYKGGADPRLL